LENITNIVAAQAGPGAPSQGIAGGAAPATGAKSGGPALSVNSSPAELNGQPPTPVEPMMGVAAAPSAPPSTDVAAPAPLLPAPQPTLTSEPGASPASTPATMAAPPVSEQPAAATPAPPMAAPSLRAPAPEATASAPPAESSSQSVNQDQNTVKPPTGGKLTLAELEKLKQIIINDFNTRQALLEKALEKASPEVRPAVRQAIALSLADYEKALSQLEQAGLTN
jgi:hypothetical protein